MQPKRSFPPRGSHAAVHAALRVIGTNISPSFGYSDTPAFDLTSAQPLSASAPVPVPAGVYDLTLNYTSNGNSQCQSASNTLPSAFVVQVSCWTATCPLMLQDPVLVTLHYTSQKAGRLKP